MRGILAIPNKLQSHIRFHTGCEVTITAVKQRPTALFHLATADVASDALQQCIIRNTNDMMHEDDIGGNGDIRLQTIDPVSILFLLLS